MFRFCRPSSALVLVMLLLAPASARGEMFVEFDALVWWTKGNPLPVLLSTSPPGTLRNDAGVLDRGATPVVGGRDGEDGARFGGRSRIGYWLDEDENNALIFDFFALGKADGHGSHSQYSAGNPILSRPFFNVVSGMEDAQLVAFPGVVDGAILIDASSTLHSAGLHCRRNYLRGPQGRLDFLFGYRYMRFREALHIQENLINRDGTIIQVGTAIDVMDRFVTENDFNGLDLGFHLESQVGRLATSITGRLAIGAIHQSVTVQGQTVVTTPGDPPVFNQGGLLALGTNIGTRDHTEWGFIPEVALNFSYPLTDNCDLQFGYTLIMINKVLRTGDQIDRNVNPSQIPVPGGPMVGPPNPGPKFEDTLLWAQGLNLGVTGTF